jgi:class 3 adenylate cyclase
MTDVNDQMNVAGVGINTASRVMGLADGGMIMVSDVVFAGLCVRGRDRFDRMRRSVF